MKKIATIALSIVITAFHGVQAMQNSDIISDASYFVQECYDQDHPLDWKINNSKAVMFFKYDGTPIETLEFESDCATTIAEMLDPNAPKPRALYCCILYWSGIELAETIRNPGWFVIFYDKHGNKIASYRYDIKTSIMSTLSTKAGKKMFSFDPYCPHLVGSHFPLDLKTEIPNITYNTFGPDINFYYGECDETEKKLFRPDDEKQVALPVSSWSFDQFEMQDGDQTISCNHDTNYYFLF